MSENSCWFLHHKKDNDKEDATADDNEDVIDAANEDVGAYYENKKQGFHEAQKSIPPDQIVLMINIIKKLSIQVEILEQKTMKSI